MVINYGKWLLVYKHCRTALYIQEYSIVFFFGILYGGDRGYTDVIGGIFW